MTDRYDDYFKDFYIKRLLDLRDRRLKLLPGNPCILKEIQEIKDLLYKKWLLIIDEPQKTVEPKQLELF